MDIQINPNNLGEAAEFVEGYKSCTKEVIDFLLINCPRKDDGALRELIGKILGLTKECERKLRTDSRPIRNLEVLDKVRRKILDKKRLQQRRTLAYQHNNYDSPRDQNETNWRQVP